MLRIFGSITQFFGFKKSRYLKLKVNIEQKGSLPCSQPKI